MLADRVASFFGGGARQRGTQYFKAGRARIEAWSDDDSIAVRVRGTREYDVRLEIAAGKTGWTVAVDCTCPYVDSCDDYCKHIWAAILAVDADGRLESPPARVDVHFLASDGEEREADDDPVDVVHAIMASGVALGPRSIARQGIARQAVERWRRFRSGRPAVSVRPHVPDWTELVNLVKPAASLARPLARARPVVVPEPWYVIEGDDSNGSGSVTVSLASRTVLKSGEPGALRQFSIHSADIGQISDPRHRMALLLLSGAIPS
jgi:hypothetical protein